MSADLSSVPLGELIWEVAGRLDRLGPPVIYLYERTDPELEELTVYHGTGPCAATGGSIPPSARRMWSSCPPARRTSCSADSRTNPSGAGRVVILRRAARSYQ